VTVDVHLAVHQVEQALDDRQPKSSATESPGRRAIGLLKRLE
jgi:hypothetical protein